MIFLAQLEYDSVAVQYDHALSVLRQCHTMAPTEATVLFDAAKLCINQLNMVWKDML